MSWDDGECSECNRNTSVVYVDGIGEVCLVCLDQAAEQGNESAREVVQ